MDSIVNARILSNPWTWITISAMLVLVCMAALVIRSHMFAPEVAANIQQET
jgi:hypothetical protein